MRALTTGSLTFDTCAVDLSLLFGLFQLSMQQCSAEVKRLVRAQFPRWTTMAVLLSNDPKNRHFAVNGRLASSPVGSKLTGYCELLALLHATCRSPDDCAQRDCDQPGKKRCSGCKAVLYCGVGCQKK